MSRARIAVQPASLAAGLASALHRAGLPVTPQRAGRFAASLVLAPPVRRERLYWQARITLLSDVEQLSVFDAVFEAVFADGLDPADTRGDPGGPPPIHAPARRPDDERPPVDRPPAGGAPGLARSAEGDASGTDRDAVLGVAGIEERLGDTAFDRLSAEELAELRGLIRRIALATPPRRTRRTTPTTRSRERLDVRRTLRRAHRTGGDPVRRIHRQRRERPRRLVLLCDVSGSMEPYSRVFLTLLQGAVAGARAEAFVFSTRLTRLTTALAVRDVDEALVRAAAAAPDWSGGTRLAESLRRFVTDHGRAGLARGAVVVILSDGWATDDPDDVAFQMVRLRRLAHRIVWVNPRKAAAGFAPTVGGMAAALPYCDAFVSGHSYAALADLAAAVRHYRRR
ncbi:MAG: VWA domain-containing protein [Geodermatophilaceae bacterium]|nr:VWA domain-containing protein [Geodermatophilaceae bacterium]